MRIIITIVHPSRVVLCRNERELWSKAWRIYRLRQVDNLLEALRYAVGL